MLSDPNKMYYSSDTYTSTFGYRYCARINISPKMKEFIGLHIHLMVGPNDYHLDWVSHISQQKPQFLWFYRSIEKQTPILLCNFFFHASKIFNFKLWQTDLKLLYFLSHKQPFRGRIKISMIHRNLNETKHDTIMTKPDILAFHRPTKEVSPRGFGFIDYANINELKNKGFIMMDTLSLKIELNIVWIT